MVATVVLNGAEISRAENLTGWTAYKLGGTGGGPTAATADGPIEGAGAVTAVCSRQHIAVMFDIGAGSELDFQPSGTNEGQILSILGQFLAAAGLLLQNDTLTSDGNGGLGVIVSSAGPATDFLEFNHDGRDTYGGAAKHFLQDPTLTPSHTKGTTSLASVRHIGLFANVGSTVLRFDNLVVDFMWVGYGLRVYGTSTTGAMAGDLLADEATNKWGVFAPLNASATAVELAGQLQLGDNVGTNAATLSNVSQGVYLAEPTYYNGTAVVGSVPAGFFTVDVVGNATGATDVTIGEKVGTGDTASGRSGVTLVGNPTYNLALTFDDGNVNALKIYGSTFENCTGPIKWGSTAAHECIGNTFLGSSQFDPVGGIEIRSCSFVSTADPGTPKWAALLWNANINIKNCNFIDNVNPDAGATELAHGIEFPAALTTSLDNLQFLGNEVGIWFSATTGNLVLNAINGTNLGASDYTNDSTGTVTINNTVTVSALAQDQATGAPIEGAIALMKAGAGGALDFEDIVTITRSGGTATVTASSKSRATGDLMVIEDANEPEYNGVHSITVLSLTSYTYPVSGSPSSPATGTILATATILFGLTDSSGLISDSGFPFGGNQPVGGDIKKGSTQPVFRPSPISGTIGSNGLAAIVNMVSDA